MMADLGISNAREPRGMNGVAKATSWLLAAVVAASAGAAFAQQPPSIPGLVVTTTPPSREPVAPLRADPAPPKPETKAKPAPRPRREASSAPARSESSGGSGRGQGIVMLVNDEPITGYEIEQRAMLMSAGSGGGDMRAKAEARWKQIIQDPKTNQRFQEYLREKAPKSRDEAVALQKEYIGGLQRKMLDQLRREARAGSIQKSRNAAREELIDERLKVQEGKRLSITVSDDEVDKAFKDMATRNKITEAQFIEQLKSQGIHPSTIKARTRAALVWRDVMRRKFGHQITVSDREIDRFVEQSADESSAPKVEMQLHRITLAVPGLIDQAALARRLSEAEQLRKRFRGCRSTQELVKGVPDARFESLGNQAAASVSEPTRSLLLNAKDGEMVPPTLASTGVELYAVCGRKTVKVDEEKRLKAQQELTMREFDIVSRRHLRDLRSEALIEKR